MTNVTVASTTSPYLKRPAETSFHDIAPAPLPAGRPEPDGLRLVLFLPAIVTLAVMLWGITGASYWRDEAATLSATARSLPQLLRMLGRLDVVHGLYDLMMWGVARTAGRSEFAFRLPSAIGMALAALGIAAIGRRVRSQRSGVLAGLVFAALPVVSHWGQSARAYALVMATAVAASYQLLRVIESPARGRLSGYAGLIALLGYFNLFGLLLIPAHAISVAAASRPAGAAGNRADSPGQAGGEFRLFRRWVAAAVAGCAAVSPIVVIGWSERAQIAWIRAPGYSAVRSLAVTLGGSVVLSALVIAALAALGAARADWPARSEADRRLVWLCLPWLVMPPAILMAASQLMHAYGYTYVLYCAAPVALLAGAGLAALRASWRAAALGLVIFLVFPKQLAVRAADGHGDNLRGVAQFLAHHASTGDAVVYPYGGLVPDWSLAYPYGFTKLRNIGELAPPSSWDSEYGRPVRQAVLMRRLESVRRLWVIEMGQNLAPPPSLAAGFEPVGTWQISDLWLRFYWRPGRYQLTGLVSNAGQ